MFSYISFSLHWIFCFMDIVFRLMPADPTWTQISTATSTTSQAGYVPGMVYDEARHNTVLFGGGILPAETELDDTWIWDGISWIKKSPAMSPPGRALPAMAYDAAHQQVVMFGGFHGSQLLSDTWVWNGTNWTQKFPQRLLPLAILQ